MNSDPLTDLIVMAMGFGSLLWALLTVVFMLSASRRLRQIALEAKQHTELLEQIAANTRPPRPPGAKPGPSITLPR